MPLDRILDVLEMTARREIAEIEQRAEAESARINAEAQTEAVRVRQEHLSAMHASINLDRTRILNQAKLEALRIVMEAREQAMQTALDGAARRLAALPHTEAYARVLQELACECVSTLDGASGLCLHVHSRDVAIMNGIVRDMGWPATVEGGLESEDSPWGCLGGIIVTTSDGRIRLVNTVAVRLQQAAKLYRAQIAERLLDKR